MKLMEGLGGAKVEAQDKEPRIGNFLGTARFCGSVRSSTPLHSVLPHVNFDRPLWAVERLMRDGDLRTQRVSEG